ncbi:MAG: hypothetical protein JJU11_12465 [Candidatus Sumerlaeia bacterium]|nr:hypothetical protein [Candidatus Sumerlaeia bacterium]
MNRFQSSLLPAIVLLLPGISAASTPVIPPAASSGNPIMNAIISNALALTILFVILSAVIGAVIRYRRKDRVLKDFDKYAVIVVLADGRRVWGKLQVYPNGLEIHYEKEVEDPSGHVERSFVLHQGEMAAIRAILRPKEMLTPAMARRRRRDLTRYVRPTPARRFARFLLIQFSILRDALVQTFTLVIGHARNIAAPSSRVGSVLQAQDRHINEIGKTVITSVNLAYDPILESFFGQGCVAEVPEAGGWRELPGVMKEYSPDWVEVLRAGWPLALEGRLPSGEESASVEERQIFLRRKGHHVVVENREEKNIELLSLVNPGGEELGLGEAVVLPGRDFLLDMVDTSGGDIVLKLLLIQPGDTILPRSSTIIRHRLKQAPLGLMENLGIRR